MTWHYTTCDNDYSVWINGDLIGTDAFWEDLEVYPIELHEGDILAIQCMDHERGKQSAGLYCCIILDDDKRWLAVDKDWCASKEEPSQEWRTTKEDFIERTELSGDNIFPRHSSERYQWLNPELHGEFIWTAEPATVVYLKKIIDLGAFQKQPR